MEGLERLRSFSCSSLHSGSTQKCIVPRFDVAPLGLVSKSGLREDNSDYGIVIEIWLNLENNFLICNGTYPTWSYTS